MKTILLSLAACALFSIAPARGQEFAIEAFTMSGGGGTSTGGVYSVAGTIGQADGGKMSGGNYSVTGGFWSLISVVQTAGSPILIIKHSGNDVIISWPSPSAGFVLQQNLELTGTNWPPSGLSVQDDGTNKSVIISSPIGKMFFRLCRP